MRARVVDLHWFILSAEPKIDQSCPLTTSMELTKTTEIPLDTLELSGLPLGKPHEILLENGVYEKPRHDRLNKMDLGCSSERLVGRD
jgi:hypothetical protein